MANETHNGNLNRSKQVKPSAAQGAHASGKTRDEEATLRKGNLPKTEAVRDAKPEAGAAKRASKKQYESSGVIPQDSEHPTHVCTSGCGCK